MNMASAHKREIINGLDYNKKTNPSFDSQDLQQNQINSLSRVVDNLNMRVIVLEDYVRYLTKELSLKIDDDLMVAEDSTKLTQKQEIKSSKSFNAENYFDNIGF